MHQIIGFPLLEAELLEAMAGRAITSTGDFDIFKLKLTDQWIIADEYFKGLDRDDKESFMREVRIDELVLKVGEGVEGAVSDLQFDLSDILNRYIQENFVPQMQPTLDDYLAAKEYE